MFGSAATPLVSAKKQLRYMGVTGNGNNENGVKMVDLQAQPKVM